MVQKMNMITAYRTWNQVAETAGIVLFGSTSAARLPLNELIQDYSVNCTVYNRSVEELQITDAEAYIQPCIVPLMPKTILLHFGESYRWLLYQLHTAVPKSRLVLISVNRQFPNADAYNYALRALAGEYGCQYAEAPNGKVDMEYELRFFQTLRTFFYDRTMSLADALRYCAS